VRGVYKQNLQSKPHKQPVIVEDWVLSFQPEMWPHQLCAKQYKLCPACEKFLAYTVMQVYWLVKTFPHTL
jgi:hypothetical protein